MNEHTTGGLFFFFPSLPHFFALHVVYAHTTYCMCPFPPRPVDTQRGRGWLAFSGATVVLQGNARLLASLLSTPPKNSVMRSLIWCLLDFHSSSQPAMASCFFPPPILGTGTQSMNSRCGTGLSAAIGPRSYTNVQNVRLHRWMDGI